MHIPDGYLGPQTYGALYAAMTPVWMVAARKVKRTLKARQVPLLALGAALSFVIQMFNVPVVGGSTGHAVGGTLVAIVLGPWAAFIAVSLTLAIQALLFGDGGITAIAANSFNMAFVLPFSGYYLYHFIAGTTPSPRRRSIAGALAGYLSLNLAAVTTAVMFGIQPFLARGADGRPLYAPYPLSIALPTMALEHLVFFGFIEAAATALILGYLSRMDRSIMAKAVPARRSLVLLWSAIGGLLVLAPLGALAPGTAWGEWGSEEIKKMLGYVPNGLETLGGLWRSALPDYTIPGIESPLVGYAMAGAIGIAVVSSATWLLGKILARREDETDPRTRFRPSRLARWGRPLALKTASAVRRVVAEIFDDDMVAARDGALQRVDPRIKLVSLLIMAVTASLVHSPLLLGALYLVGLVLAAVSGIGLVSMLRRVWLSAGLFASIVAVPAMTAWITRGPVFFTLGPIPFSEPGVAGGATLILRVVASTNVALLIALTTRWPDILQGLSALKIPEIFIMTLGMAQRYIVSLLRTIEQLHLAKESRTIGRLPASEERRWVTERMAYVVKKSIKMGDDVYSAMLSRGYAGRSPVVKPMKAGARDFAWLSGALAMAAALLYINYGVLL